MGCVLSTLRNMLRLLAIVLMATLNWGLDEMGVERYRLPVIKRHGDVIYSMATTINTVL